MSETRDGGPAFPIPAVCSGEFTAYPQQDGMSLRDWFAGHFMAGSAALPSEPLDLDIAADQFDVDCALREHWGHVARTAYIAADAMLAARAKTEG